MCGRFTLTVDLKTLESYLENSFKIKTMPKNLNIPRYNIAPSQQVLAIINDGKENRLGYLNWGFLPPWEKTKKTQIINARSETIDHKKSFKDSFSRKRCIILSDGFFEWHQSNKTPYYFTLKNRNIVALAGIYSTNILEDGSWYHHTAIVTTEANTMLSNIHTRMPVILDKESIYDYLNPKINDPIKLKKLLTPYDASLMTHKQVSKTVNDVRNDSPNCIKPIQKK